MTAIEGTGGNRDTANPSAAASKRRGLLLAPLIVFVAVAIMFAFALQRGDPSKLPSALIGKPVPQLTLPAVDGLIHDGLPIAGFSAADLESGQVTVVNFWASWCVPCVQEHPLLLALKERTGVALYGVNHKDSPTAARRFLGRYGNPFAAVGSDGAGRVAIEWGVYGMPETFVVNGQGVIVYKHVGPLSPQSLERELIPAVRKAQGG